MSLAYYHFGGGETLTLTLRERGVFIAVLKIDFNSQIQIFAPWRLSIEWNGKNSIWTIGKGCADYPDVSLNGRGRKYGLKSSLRYNNAYIRIFLFLFYKSCSDGSLYMPIYCRKELSLIWSFLGSPFLRSLKYLLVLKQKRNKEIVKEDLIAHVTMYELALTH
ncbi:hypothetical protein Lal_00011823 [Lupinus albus]|nr:hypothetical protein Lal_00011823 [Lupinus albus]